jgi:vacuolar-type H+-ATPase subunit I/STV1
MTKIYHLAGSRLQQKIIMPIYTFKLLNNGVMAGNILLLLFFLICISTIRITVYQTYIILIEGITNTTSTYLTHH